MKVYLSFASIPELRAKSKAEVEAAYKRVSTLALKNWEWWLALVVAASTTGFGAWFGGGGVSGVVGAGIGGAVGGLVHHVVLIHIARKHHAAELTGHSDA